MTELITGAWLLQQVATLPDTVVMKTVATGRGWFETVTGIASGVMSITLVVLTFVLAPAAMEFWKTFKKARALLDNIDPEDVGQLARSAKGLALRLGELNALLQVAQQEAEQAFVSTASAVRGVRTGAATLSALADHDDDLGDDDDGDDDDYESDEDALDASERRPHRGGSRPSARPRLRPKRRA
jgi:hypothetical protein